MNLKYHYWFWKNALSPRLCDQIIDYGLRHKKEKAVTGGQGQNRDLVKNPLNAKEICHVFATLFLSSYSITNSHESSATSTP